LFTFRASTGAVPVNDHHDHDYGDGSLLFSQSEQQQNDQAPSAREREIEKENHSPPPAPYLPTEKCYFNPDFEKDLIREIAVANDEIFTLTNSEEVLSIGGLTGRADDVIAFTPTDQDHVLFEFLASPVEVPILSLTNSGPEKVVEEDSNDGGYFSFETTVESQEEDTTADQEVDTTSATQKAPTATTNEDVEMREVATFDNNTDKPEKPKSSPPPSLPAKTRARKSVRARNKQKMEMSKIRKEAAEKKLAIEKNIAKCRNYRIKKKQSLQQCEIELRELDEKNKSLKAKERNLTRKIEKLREIYLAAIKRDICRCCRK